MARRKRIPKDPPPGSDPVAPEEEEIKTYESEELAGTPGEEASGIGSGEKPLRENDSELQVVETNGEEDTALQPSGDEQAELPVDADAEDEVEGHTDGDDAGDDDGEIDNSDAADDDMATREDDAREEDDDIEENFGVEDLDAEEDSEEEDSEKEPEEAGEEKAGEDNGGGEESEDAEEEERESSLPMTSIIEAVLFAAREPLKVVQLARAVGKRTRQDAVREAIAELNVQYLESGRAFEIAEVSGRYQLMSRPEYSEHIMRIYPKKELAEKDKTQRLTPAMLDTLAIIAYKQPVMRSEIEHIRGVSCSNALRSLIERGSVKEMGRRTDLVGKPAVFGTTDNFLIEFGLGSLEELPMRNDFIDPGTPPPVELSVLDSNAEVPENNADDNNDDGEDETAVNDEDNSPESDDTENSAETGGDTDAENVYNEDDEGESGNEDEDGDGGDLDEFEDEDEEYDEDEDEDEDGGDEDDENVEDFEDVDAEEKSGGDGGEADMRHDATTLPF